MTLKVSFHERVVLGGCKPTGIVTIFSRLDKSAKRRVLDHSFECVVAEDVHCVSLHFYLIMFAIISRSFSQSHRRYLVSAATKLWAGSCVAQFQLFLVVWYFSDMLRTNTLVDILFIYVSDFVWIQVPHDLKRSAGQLFHHYWSCLWESTTTKQSTNGDESSVHSRAKFSDRKNVGC